MIAWLPMLVIVCSVFLFALLRRRGTLAFGLCIVSLAALLIGYARDRSNTRHDAASNTDVDAVWHPLEVVDAFLQRSQDERLRRQQTVAEITHDHDFPWASDSQHRGGILSSSDVDATETADGEVPPSDGSHYPPWVQNPPAEVDGKLAFVLVTDPFDNRFLCEDDMRKLTQVAVGAFARQLADHQNIPLIGDLILTDDELAKVSHDRFYALRPTSMGEMTQLYQLTVFGDRFREDLLGRVEQTIVERRVVTVSLASGSVLLGLLGLFGMFRYGARKTPDPFAS